MHSYRRASGFTLVEIMITVAIIGLLAAIAIPSFIRARKQTQMTSFINDLRIIGDAFQMYHLENKGTYPADTMPGIEPPEMAGYLTKVDFLQPTPVGGQWDWDYATAWCLAGISVYQSGWSDADMQMVDAQIDDGDLDTGLFRRRPNGFVYILAE